ncbi:MAG TPA: DUF3786 domain-containing protein [Candidatus Omnitrophica bacterium]|nr:DUF3786 domain-containing protein [Candidatus Omnitrophota bacterium]
MGYELALVKAYLELESLTSEKKFSVKLLADEYEVDLENKRIFSLACNVPAKDYLGVLLLHYLIRKVKGLPSLKGAWISFRQLPGGEGYFPAFTKRVIRPLLRKYKDNPERLLELTKRFKAEREGYPDLSISLEVLERVPFLITLQRGDEEFTPLANLLFDGSIKDIFSTEDVVVLSEFVARNI